MSMFELILKKSRLLSVIAPVLLLLWGGYGLYINDLLIPSLEDEKPTYLMFAAFICGAMMLTANIIGQIEPKNREASPFSFARYVVGWGGWLLFGMVLALHLLIETIHTLQFPIH